MEVPSTSSKILVSAFFQGLAKGDFFRLLAKKPPTSYDDLLGRAEKYINMEEAQGVKKTEPDSAHSGMSRLERRAPPPAPRNVILRPLLNYGPSK